MTPSRRRLAILGALGVALALGAWWRSHGRSSPTLEDTTSPPEPPAVRPAASDLAAPPAPSSSSSPVTSRTATRSGDAMPTQPAEGGTVVRRVRVRLADGRGATSGSVVWSDPKSGHTLSNPSLGVFASAPIDADGVATLTLAAAIASRVGDLVVAVPGEPSLFRGGGPGLPEEPLDVALPEGLPFSGTVADGDDRPVPDLAILVTSANEGPSAVLDEHLDLARRVEGGADAYLCHVETRTDASGRFAVRIPAMPATSGSSAIVFVRSADARWFVNTVGSYVALPGAQERGGVPIRVAPGVALDLRATDRLSGDPIGYAYLRLVTPAYGIQGTSAFGAEIARATNHVRVPRGRPRDVPYTTTLVLTAPGHAPAVARVSIPAGIDETRVDLVLDRSDDVEHTGLVELTIPGAVGTPGTATPWSLEIATPDPAVGRADIVDETTWARPDGLDARLAPGRWLLRLLPEGRHTVAYEAVVDVAARVTSRVAMTKQPDGTRAR